MELPSELRLSVYEALLVQNKTLNPAILRKSRQVHSEALAVLWERNELRAKLKCCIIENHRRGVSITRCCHKFNRLGSASTFYQRVPRPLGLKPLLLRLLQNCEMGMLRALMHFAVGLYLATRGRQEMSAFLSQADDAISNLCLALTGLSKLRSE